MMAGRNAVLPGCLSSCRLGSPILEKPRRDSASCVQGSGVHTQKTIVVSDSSCLEHASSNVVEKQDVKRDSVGSFLKPWLSSILRINSGKQKEAKLQRELKEKVNEIHELVSGQQARDEHIRDLTLELDRARRHNQELIEASASPRQRLNPTTETKVEQALEGAANSQKSTLVTTNTLEAQVALNEQQAAAQEPLTSGSSSDHHAIPGVLEPAACKVADNVMEDLAKMGTDRTDVADGAAREEAGASCEDGLHQPILAELFTCDNLTRLTDAQLEESK